MSASAVGFFFPVASGEDATSKKRHEAAARGFWRRARVVPLEADEEEAKEGLAPMYGICIMFHAGLRHLMAPQTFALCLLLPSDCPTHEMLF